jgi:hypothetical protein
MSIGKIIGLILAALLFNVLVGTIGIGVNNRRYEGYWNIGADDIVMAFCGGVAVLIVEVIMIAAIWLR